MPRAFVDALKTQLKHQRRLDTAHRAELFQCGFADHAVDLLELFIRQARVSLGESNELQGIGPGGLALFDGLDNGLGLCSVNGLAVPYCKGVVGVERCAAAMTGLRVDEHTVDGHGLDLPFPPQPVGLGATRAISCVLAFEHEALDTPGAGLGAQSRQRGPRIPLFDR